MAYGILNLDVIDLDLAVERRVVHSEQFRGAALMAAGYFERAADQLDFEARDLVIERDAAGDVERGRRFRHVRRVAGLRLRADYLLAQAIERYLVGAGDDHRALGRRFKLAHVAGPGVTFERLQDLGRDLVGDRPPVLIVVFADEVLGERQDVFLAVAQRRQVNVDDVQTIKEVFAEIAGPDGALEVGICRGDDPNVDLVRLRVSERGEFAFLDHAQQPGLGFGRDRADLVEEDRAVVGDLEQAFFGRDGAGERAFRVAEEFRFQKLRRDVAAIDGDELPGLGARAGEMDRARDDLFAGTRFAGDQHCRARRGDLLDQVVNFAHRDRIPHDLFAVRRFAQRAAQHPAFLVPAAARDAFGDPAQDDRVFKRLADAPECAHLPGGDGRVERRICRDHYHYGFAVELQQLFERPQPADARHRDVEQHSVIGPLAEARQPLFAGLGQINAIAVLREKTLQNVAHYFFIIYN